MIAAAGDYNENIIRNVLGDAERVHSYVEERKGTRVRVNRKEGVYWRVSATYEGKTVMKMKLIGKTNLRV